jgi:hypothetical protein
VRFYGRSSRDVTSTIHFKTTSPELVSYFTTYTAPTANSTTRNDSLINNAMPLVGHEANLPGGITELGSQAYNEMALTYGLFMGAEGRSWRIRDANATVRDWSMDDSSAGITHSTLHQVWVRPFVQEPAVATTPEVSQVPYSSCRDLKTADATAVSGVRWLNINGTFVRSYCDMEAGGWMLVLNYVRGGGLTPVLQLRNQTTGFPLLRSTRLGSDESWMRGAMSPWGHIQTSALSQARARVTAAAAVVLPVARCPAPRTAYHRAFRRTSFSHSRTLSHTHIPGRRWTLTRCASSAARCATRPRS